MRAMTALAVIAAMLAQGPASAAPEAGSGDAPQKRMSQGYCRMPEALPDLGQETQYQTPRRRHDAPVPMASAAEAGGDVSVTARRAESGAADRAGVDGVFGEAEAPMAEAPPPPPSASPSAESRKAISPPRPPYPGRPYPRPRPYPQAGLLTAGEHDDLLNPELYASYLRRSDLGQQIAGLPQIDTSRLLRVAVHDRSGRPVRGAMVEVTCADGNRLRLPTMADGTVALFPELDRLSETVLIAIPGEDRRAINIPRAEGGLEVRFTTDRLSPARNLALDLMLVIDTTGSMGDEIRYLQTELDSILAALRARHRGLDLRVGFVFYRDIGDHYVTSTVPLSGNLGAARNELAQRHAGGGGDYPEAMDQALIRAAGADWRPGAVKSLLLVADAPPHDENFDMAWLAAEHLRQKRVHVVPVAASGVADKAEYAMRAMAALTQSRYTFLTDDSGVGNPHAPPAIDCYLVTRLDALLRRVIDSQLSGRRIEPEQGEIIRSVGNYDKGRCILPQGWQQG